jgi:tetratricopeptide (TPR) repeat protein
VPRARDIFQSLPELHSATFLLEASLLSHIGQFEKAIAAITRYQYSERQINPTTLQFVKAKLLFHSGKFTHALSEYEDLLEYMEQEVERQMKMQDRHNTDGNTLAVIDGAAALTGVGLTKFMIHHTGQGENDDVESSNEIIESLRTATELLLESRQDALMSSEHLDIALDLGLAVVISLTNFGLVQCLLSNKRDSSIKRWKQGLEVLDQILRDSMNSATVIPNHKYQCIQSLRARLYCNIACVLLQLDANLREQNMLVEVDEEALKEASDMAKKALRIYDEILNGPNLASEDNNASTNGDAENEEWNEMLKENPDPLHDDGDNDGESESNVLDSEDQVISPLWKDYHRAESARALGLVAMCYYHAGAAVTSEGLLQSALDASSSYPYGQCLKNDDNGIATKGVSLSSPNLGLIARDIRLEYALLCDKWDKRKGDADKYRLQASRIEREGALKDFGGNKFVSGLVSSIWLFSPLDFP